MSGLDYSGMDLTSSARRVLGAAGKRPAPVNQHGNHAGCLPASGKAQYRVMSKGVTILYLFQGFYGCR